MATSSTQATSSRSHLQNDTAAPFALRFLSNIAIGASGLDTAYMIWSTWKGPGSAKLLEPIRSFYWRYGTGAGVVSDVRPHPRIFAPWMEYRHVTPYSLSFLARGVASSVFRPGWGLSILFMHMPSVNALANALTEPSNRSGALSMPSALAMFATASTLSAYVSHKLYKMAFISGPITGATAAAAACLTYTLMLDPRHPYLSWNGGTVLTVSEAAKVWTAATSVALFFALGTRQSGGGMPAFAINAHAPVVGALVGAAWYKAGSKRKIYETLR
jgi:hypothetical protein